MIKITYWVSVCHGDSDVYSMRGKTRKAVLAMLVEGGNDITRLGDDYNYGKPRKVTAEFYDRFDILQHCMSECRGCWE